MNLTILRLSLGGVSIKTRVSIQATMSEVVFELLPGGSERGGDVLFRKEFMFVFHKYLHGGGRRWLCAERKKSGCKAHLNTRGSEVVKIFEEHTHPPDNKKKEVCLRRTSKKAYRDMFSSPQEFVGHPLIEKSEDVNETQEDFQSNPSGYAKWLQTEDSQEDQSQTQCLNETVDFTETPPCMPEITEVTSEAPRTRSKRKTASHPSTSKMSRHEHDPKADFMFGAIEPDQLGDILSDRASYARREDSYDFFGKYIASMLRDLGPPTAMRLQAKITSLITEAICPHLEQSEQATNEAHTSVNDNSDEHIPCAHESVVVIKSES